MKKKTICFLGLVIVLLICIIAYFKPLSFSNAVNEHSQISVIRNTYGIKNGKPDIDVVEYKDITAEQKSAFLTLLEKYTYRRTLGTLFSNGTMTGMGTEILTIHIFDDLLGSNVFVISAKEIVVNGKNYRMKNAEEFLAQIIALMEQAGRETGA